MASSRVVGPCGSAWCVGAHMDLIWKTLYYIFPIKDIKYVCLDSAQRHHLPSFN